MKISMTIHDATPNELAKVLDSIKNLDVMNESTEWSANESTAMWTDKEIQAAWELLTLGCQDIIRKGCEWPTEVSAEELKAVVGKRERVFGGTLSSVGAMMRKRPFKELGWPIRRMRNSQGMAVYRIRDEWRNFISKLDD